MVAKHHEQRGIGAQLPEVPALRVVLRLGLMKVLTTLVGHEGVAQIHVEIGFVGQRVGQRALVHLGIHVGVQVRVGLDGEGEGCAGSGAGAKAVLVARLGRITADGLQHQTVAILGAGLQATKFDRGHFAGSDRHHGASGLRVGAFLPPLDRRLGGLRHGHGCADRVIGGLNQHDVGFVRRHFGVERGHLCKQPALATFALRSALATLASASRLAIALACALATTLTAALTSALSATLTLLAATSTTLATTLARLIALRVARARARVAQIDGGTAKRDVLDRCKQSVARHDATGAKLRLSAQGEQRDGVHLLARPLGAGGRVFRLAVHGVGAPRAKLVLAGSKALRACRNAPVHHVHMRLAARTRNVMHDQRQTLGALGQVAPREWR